MIDLALPWLLTPPIWLQAPMTSLLLLLTVLTSWYCFGNAAAQYRLSFFPYEMKRDQSWFRFWTVGLVHSNWLHLIFNGFVLWEFGKVVEQYFTLKYGELGIGYFLGLYLSALPLASSFDYYRHLDNPSYRAVGASGAVSAVVFVFIVLFPYQPLGFIFLPGISFPASYLGIAYLVYSSYMGQRGDSRVGHFSHFWGGIWGMVYILFLEPEHLSKLWG